jgi:dihydroorotase
MTLMEVLIRDVRPFGGRDVVDIAISDGRIRDIGTGLTPVEGTHMIDAGGRICLPGLVDLHTHLREPGREDTETIETGCQAAALGGYTAVHAMANTQPVADTAGVVEQVWRRGREIGLCEVVPVGAVTVGLGGERLAELGAMAESAARVRVFSDDGICVSDPLLMRRALEYVKGFDGVVAQHAQEPRLTIGAQMNEGALSGELGLPGWPAVAEEAIIARDVLLAEHVGSRLHVCHLSTRGSVEIIRWAKDRGIDVTAEVTPHHLMLTEDLARSYDPLFKVNPPLRTMEDVVATGSMTWEQVADRMSIAPARIARLKDQGRPLAPGEPAHLTIIDPDAPWTVRTELLASRSRNSPYVERTLPASVWATFFHGQPTVLEGSLA